MKKFITMVLVISAVAACQPKQEETASNAYGESISTEGAMALASLDNQLADQDSVQLTLKGTIEKTCAKKGCWMTVEDENGNTIRVTFKDYGFFVPKEGVEGKEVIFSGIAKRKITDIETLRHFAEDAGKSQEEIDAIVDAKEEVEFVATGVVILDAEEKSAK